MGGQTLTGEMFIIPGKGGELVDRGDNTYGGKWVINPSGGLISKGHPLGATGNLWRLKPFLSFHIVLSPAVITILSSTREKLSVGLNFFNTKFLVWKKANSYCQYLFNFCCCNAWIV